MVGLLPGTLAPPEAMVEEPPPSTDEPGPDSDDDEDEQETSPLPPPPTARTTRRGFLGAAAGVVAGTAAAAAVPQAPPAEPTATAVGGMTPTMEQMATFFSQLMDQRDAGLLSELDRRLAAIRAELPVPNGVAEASPAELAARPGEYPPSVLYANLKPAPAGGPVEPPSAGLPSSALGQQLNAQAAHPWLPGVQQPSQANQLSARRLVAFIPKEDPYNPRQTMFRGWSNGREYRARRGQIMIVPLGMGVDWAKNGHGNCVDIAAMQGVGSVEPLDIPQAPDFSRPSSWDGFPMTGQSSIPIGRSA